MKIAGLLLGIITFGLIVGMTIGDYLEYYIRCYVSLKAINDILPRIGISVSDANKESDNTDLNNLEAHTVYVIKTLDKHKIYFKIMPIILICAGFTLGVLGTIFVLTVLM